MPLNSATVTFPNAINSVDATAADKLALVIEEFTGMVEGTINRKSILADHVPVRQAGGPQQPGQPGVILFRRRLNGRQAGP